MREDFSMCFSNCLLAYYPVVAAMIVKVDAAIFLSRSKNYCVCRSLLVLLDEYNITNPYVLPLDLVDATSLIPHKSGSLICD
jgi:hypothetical protein